MAIPFPVLLTSKMQPSRRVALLILFALGIFVTIIQIIRIQTIKNLVNYLDSSTSILWSIVEANMGIIITCVPALAPLVKYYFYSDRGGERMATGGRGPRSKYAMQSWKGSSSSRRDGGGGSGMHGRYAEDGGEDDYSEGMASSRKRRGEMMDDDDDSTEDILGVSRKDFGIVKTTQVVVAHEAAVSTDGSYSDKNSL